MVLGESGFGLIFALDCDLAPAKSDDPDWGRMPFELQFASPRFVLERKMTGSHEEDEIAGLLAKDTVDKAMEFAILFWYEEAREYMSSRPTIPSLKRFRDRSRDAEAQLWRLQHVCHAIPPVALAPQREAIVEAVRLAAEDGQRMGVKFKAIFETAIALA